MAKHALYATTTARNGERLTFRVGQPVRANRADARWYRNQARVRGWEQTPARVCTVRFDGKRYPVSWFEMRETTPVGRGIGEDRHRDALTVPYRALRTAKN
jgi:hypothetical protein